MNGWMCSRCGSGASTVEEGGGGVWYRWCDRCGQRTVPELAEGETPPAGTCRRGRPTIMIWLAGAAVILLGTIVAAVMAAGMESASAPFYISQRAIAVGVGMLVGAVWSIGCLIAAAVRFICRFSERRHSVP